VCGSKSTLVLAETERIEERDLGLVVRGRAGWGRTIASGERPCRRVWRVIPTKEKEEKKRSSLDFGLRDRVICRDCGASYGRVTDGRKGRRTNKHHPIFRLRFTPFGIPHT